MASTCSISTSFADCAIRPLLSKTPPNSQSLKTRCDSFFALTKFRCVQSNGNPPRNRIKASNTELSHYQIFQTHISSCKAVYNQQSPPAPAQELRFTIGLMISA